MRYPNIELLEYICEKVLLSEHDTTKRFIPDFDVYVFPQTWPNTGGGMARRGFCYGDAMTKQYTTVLINHQDNAAFVCFGNMPAYMVKPIPSSFYADLMRHRMEGVEHTDSYDNTRVRELEE